MAEKIIIPNTWCTPLAGTEPEVAEYPDCVRYDFSLPILLGEVSQQPLSLILYLMYQRGGSLPYNTFLPFEDETSFRITPAELIPGVWSGMVEQLRSTTISPKSPHGYFYGAIQGFKENGLLVRMDDQRERWRGYKWRMPDEIKSYMKRLHLTVVAGGKAFDCRPAVAYEDTSFLSDSFVTELGKPTWRGKENLMWLHACGDHLGLPLDPSYYPNVDIMIREEQPILT